MAHERIDLEYDQNLINSFLNDITTKYTILYLYIIRKDLFKNLDKDLINKYEKVIILDDIYKNNIETLWSEEFIDLVIDLGLFKNIRSRREYDQKDSDFILKMGEYTITIERNTILTPKDTLYRMISKKFKTITLSEFELALTKLKEVRCETTSAIHRFIYEIGDNDYILSDDLYEILDRFGNGYQALKIEPTTNGLLQLCKEIQDKVVSIVKIFNPILDNEPVIKKLTKALEAKIQINKDEDRLEITEISIKLKILEQDITFTISKSDFQIMAGYKDEMETINKDLMEIKSNYSGNQDYLGFLEKIPEKIEAIQKTLIQIRENAIGAKKAILDLEERIKSKTSDDLYDNYEEFITTNQDIKNEPSIEGLLQYSKEIKDKSVNFIRIFNPIMNNNTIINKIIKTIEKNEGMLINIKKENLTLEEISLKLKVSANNFKLKLSNSDFQILTNYQKEMDSVHNQLVKIESNSSEKEGSQELLNEMKENIVGARKAVLDIEKRLILKEKK